MDKDVKHISVKLKNLARTIPFALGETGAKSLTVGFWVRYSVPQGKGTYFVMRGLK